MPIISPDHNLGEGSNEENLTASFEQWKGSLEELNQELSELIPAVPTLFTENNEINYVALENRFTDYKEAWIKDILIAWTSWLSSLIWKKEQINYIEKSVSMWKKYWLNVIAWTWWNNTKEQNNLTQSAFEIWGQASLLLAPYYLKASESDLLRHFHQALNKWPWIIYLISWKTGIQIPLEILQLLSKHPNFIWVKECDWEDRIKELSEYWIKVWSWNDDEVLSNTNSWAYWTITVAWNLAPWIIQELITKESVSENTQKISDLVNFLMFLPWEPNPKWISNIYSMIEWVDKEKYIPWFRMPTWAITNAQQEFVRKQLEILWVDSKVFWNNYKLFS